MKIYLGGPIRTNEYVDWDIRWRANATRSLNAIGVEALNPLDNKAFVNGVWVDSANMEPCCPYTILATDINSIRQADIVLMNLLFLADHKAIGSFAEIGMAIALFKTLVVLTSDKTISEHPFIIAGADLITDDPQIAYRYIKDDIRRVS